MYRVTARIASSNAKPRDDTSWTVILNDPPVFGTWCKTLMAESFDIAVRSSATARDDVIRRNIPKPENAATPVTPPTRYISSTYSTPGSTFGQEQDAIIIELNPRYLKAGIEGESHPQCRYDFTPSAGKRLGDYRQYLPNYVRPRETLETWGDGYELWRNDTRGLDLGLLKDRLERAVREVYNKHILVDTGSARLILVLPSLLPHPVLATVLQTMFERWPYPSITLLSPPATALIAAGLRSGLVVDIGWEETVVTAVYEYREIKSHRTTRASKSITKRVASWIKKSLGPVDRFDLEMIEEVLTRAGEYACAENLGQGGESMLQENSDIIIQWPTDKFARPISFSKADMRKEILDALLGTADDTHPDDEELPLPRVIYNALLGLTPDVRGICISRIVFAGDGSQNKNLVSAILTAFTKLLDSRGWTSVEGRKLRAKRNGLSELAQVRALPADAKHADIVLSEAAFAEERYLREKVKHNQAIVHGVVRQVDTLGPWAGASLVTLLKVKSFVEIQRDRFLAHGLGGASRELDISVVQPQGRGAPTARPKAGERTSWTLSGWG